MNVGLIVLGSQMNASSKLFEEGVSLMSHCTKGFDCNILLCIIIRVNCCINLKENKEVKATDLSSLDS